MASKSVCRIQRFTDGYVVSLLGPATMRASHTFRHFVSQSLEGGLRIVVDLESCDYLDSTFLGCLIGLHKQSLRTGGDTFQVLAAQACRVRLLATTGLHHILVFAAARPATEDDEVRLELAEVDEQTLGRHVMLAHRNLANLGGKDAAKFHSIADRLQQELEAAGE